MDRAATVAQGAARLPAPRPGRKAQKVPPKPVLHWVEGWEDGEVRHLGLYLGTNPELIAWLRKRNKRWLAVVRLPGVSPAREYAPLDEQRADVEARVSGWLARCFVAPEGDPPE